MRSPTRAWLPLVVVVAALVGTAPAAAAAPRTAPGVPVRSWLTTADGRALLAPVGGLALGADRPTAANRVVVDDAPAARCSAGPVRR